MNDRLVSVLLVEDNPTDAMVLSETLTDVGHMRFMLTHVERMEAALRRLGESRPDVVLLDLGLPDSQGLATFERLHAAAPAVPVIVLTGLDDERLGTRALQAGAQDYLVKGKTTGFQLSRAISYAIERSRADAALRANEERYRLILETTSDAVLLLDEQSVIWYANRAVEEVFGYAPAELVGGNLSLLQPPRMQEQHQHGFQRYLKSGQRTLDWRAIEVTGRRRDGSDFPMEVAFTDMALGGRRIFAGFMRDITQRKRAEAALKESEQKFESILGSLNDAVWSQAIDSGRMIYLNAAAERMYGRGLQEFFDRPEFWLEMIHPEDRARIVESNTELLERGTADREYRIVRDDGSIRWLQSRAQVIRDAAGVPLRLDGIVTDITERMEQQERIARLSRTRAVLSNITALIMRVRNQQELFDQACRILVEQGGMVVAWIGQLGDGGTLQPAAFFSLDGRSAPVRTSLQEDGADQDHSMMRQLLEGKAVIFNDVATDAFFRSSRDQLLAVGTRAAAVLPLNVGGKVAGSLNLGAAEPGFFDEAERKLFSEIASELSFGMEFIAREVQIDYLAYYDPVTGLANRRLFGERLNPLVQRAREAKEMLGVLLFDIERFKSLNDALGHAGGDELLKRIGERMALFAGGTTYIARVGGDRFAVVMPNLKGAAPLTRVLQEQVWERMSRPFQVAGQEVHLGAKLGIALFPADGDDAEGLLRNAEAALKTAKSTGERYLFYTQQMSAAMAGKTSLESQMRRALEQKEFVLHYQPKVDLRSGKVCGAEALIRWNSLELGLVPPLQFIPLLEETGMILDAGRWALEQALADRRAWLADGLDAPLIAVNVSPLQLRRPDFVDVVRAVLGGEPGAAAGLELEITESMLMTEVDLTIGKLKSVRAMGIGIAIDDFGTGYSSLAYLSKLPVNAVKIDRSFIINMTDSADTMSIVSTIISMAHTMNLKVVAEGVDSHEQLKFLRLLRCDEIQGYLFSKALPANAFAELLRDPPRLAGL